MVSTFDPALIQPSGLTLAAAIGMGVLASANMCAVVRLPILAAYVAGSGGPRKRSLVLAALFTLGLAAGTVLLGLIAALTADGVPRTLHVSKYSFWVLGLSLIVVGVLVSGLVNSQLLPPKWRAINERVAKVDLPGAVLLGFVLGLLQTPACPGCRADLLYVVGAAPANGISLSGLVLIVGFVVGQSVLTLAVGALTGLLKPNVLLWLRTRMCSIEPRLQLLTGNMLVVLGIYFVVVG